MQFQTLLLRIQLYLGMQQKMFEEDPFLEAFFDAYQGDGKKVVELFENDPSLILYHTDNGNTVLHAWLRIKRNKDVWTFKLLHMLLDELRKSDRTPFDLNLIQLAK